MTGSVIDLSVPGAQIADPVIVDTNLIVDFLVGPLIGVLPLLRATRNADRANQFFGELLANNRIGIVTPTVFKELVHVAVKFKYQQAWRRLRSGHHHPYSRTVKSWQALYKQDATILQNFRGDLTQLRLRLIASGMLLIAPEELGPIDSGRTYDEELIHLVGTYGLDSNDAVILMEARRSGVTDIISLDPDLQRAQADFTIYTWL